ncbi:hypothetical protein JB92DRAFT_2837286 [Gautieria morchelliformis]|nr:hypothetical protein JB92DRAFT_2837286 [Gautieria morchelliformis]
MLDSGVGCDERERSPGANEDGRRSVEGHVVQFAHRVNSSALKMTRMAAFQVRVIIPTPGFDCKCDVVYLSGTSTIRINLKLLMRSKHSRNDNCQAEVSSISVSRPWVGGPEDRGNVGVAELHGELTDGGGLAQVELTQTKRPFGITQRESLQVSISVRITRLLDFHLAYKTY